MNQGRHSLYWRLFLSYLLVIILTSITLFITSDLLAPVFFERRMGPMQHRMHMEGGMSDTMAQQLNETHRRAMTQAVLWGIAVSSVIAGGVSLFVTGRIVSPLRAMQRISRRVAKGHYHERLEASGPGEIAELAQSFNAMASALEQVETRRRELLGNVSHELRTPLSSLRGYIDGLQDGVFAPDAETLGACQKQLVRLERLIQDLSLLSRVEAGSETVHPEPLPVQSLLAQASASLKPQYEEKGVTLELTPATSDASVYTDPERTLQVFSNLLGNALRYTPAGKTVQLGAEVSEHEVVFSITDRGDGIPAEHLPHLFERFYRVDKSRSREAGSGSGIGLTIAKHFVEAQGGQIGAESTPGEGSRFWFSLPRHA